MGYLFLRVIQQPLHGDDYYYSCAPSRGGGVDISSSAVVVSGIEPGYAYIASVLFGSNMGSVICESPYYIFISVLLLVPAYGYADRSALIAPEISVTNLLIIVIVTV